MAPLRPPHPSWHFEETPFCFHFVSILFDILGVLQVYFLLSPPLLLSPNSLQCRMSSFFGGLHINEYRTHLHSLCSMLHMGPFKGTTQSFPCKYTFLALNHTLYKKLLLLGRTELSPSPNRYYGCSLAHDNVYFLFHTGQNSLLSLSLYYIA